MKKLVVGIGVVALLAAGTAVALANSGGEPLLVAQGEGGDDAQPESESASPATPRLRGAVLGGVLDELVDEGVISRAQAEEIEERVAERRAERHEELHAERRHRFELRFPGREFGSEFPQRIEIPEEALDQLRGLMESLSDELERPFGRRFFHPPGDSLREFLDDGELSTEELEQLETELRELAERMRDHFDDRFGSDTEGTASEG